MHICDIYCVKTICDSIFGDYSVTFSVSTFRKVMFTAVIMLKFL
jgi:hypothetical protein